MGRRSCVCLAVSGHALAASRIRSAPANRAACHSIQRWMSARRQRDPGLPRWATDPAFGGGEARDSPKGIRPPVRSTVRESASSAHTLLRLPTAMCRRVCGSRYVARTTLSCHSHKCTGAIGVDRPNGTVVTHTDVLEQSSQWLPAVRNADRSTGAPLHRAPSPSRHYPPKSASRAPVLALPSRSHRRRHSGLPLPPAATPHYRAVRSGTDAHERPRYLLGPLGRPANDARWTTPRCPGPRAHPSSSPTDGPGRARRRRCLVHVCSLAFHWRTAPGVMPTTVPSAPMRISSSSVACEPA